MLKPTSLSIDKYIHYHFSLKDCKYICPHTLSIPTLIDVFNLLASNLMKKSDWRLPYLGDLSRGRKWRHTTCKWHLRERLLMYLNPTTTFFNIPPTGSTLKCHFQIPCIVPCFPSNSSFPVPISVILTISYGTHSLC